MWVAKIRFIWKNQIYYVVKHVLRHQTFECWPLGWVLIRTTTTELILKIEIVAIFRISHATRSSSRMSSYNKNSYLKVLPMDSLDKIDAFCTVNEIITTFCSKVIRIWILLNFPQIAVIHQFVGKLSKFKIQ